MEDVAVVSEGLVDLGQVRAGLLEELAGGIEVAAVDGADGVGREANDVAAGAEGQLAGAVLGVQVGAEAIGDVGEAVGVQSSPSQRSQ